MGGTTKGFISFKLIGRRRIITHIPPSPPFRMVDGTYAQNDGTSGVTGIRTEGMSTADIDRQS